MIWVIIIVVIIICLALSSSNDEIKDVDEKITIDQLRSKMNQLQSECERRKQHMTSVQANNFELDFYRSHNVRIEEGYDSRILYLPVTVITQVATVKDVIEVNLYGRHYYRIWIEKSDPSYFSGFCFSAPLSSKVAKELKKGQKILIQGPCICSSSICSSRISSVEEEKLYCIKFQPVSN